VDWLVCARTYARWPFASSHFAPLRTSEEHLEITTKHESAVIGPRVCDPQRLRCLESVRIGRECLENWGVLRLTEPRSGVSITIRRKAIIFGLDSCLAAADEVGVVRTGVRGHPRGQ